jgi:translation initiation factor IF-2
VPLRRRQAPHRTELCKHALAVELHRRALALLQGPAAEPAPAPRPAPAAPSACLPAAPSAPSAPVSHAWDVHEAPASACFKFRVGTMELLYTLRGVDDAELQRRITATLPTLQEVIEACEERAAQRAAAREAQAAQAQQAPAAAVPQADLQALLQQAVQQALAAANGQATPPPPAAPAHGQAQAAPTPEGWCAVHQVPMELRQNERGSWWSHRLADGSYCKGK